MSTFIQLKDVKLTESGPTRGSRGDFDVLGSYSWTASKLDGEIKKEIPYVILTEYEQSLASVYQSLNYWWESFSNITDKNMETIYQNLYKANSTNVTYKLPYFSQNFWNSTQSWTESEKNAFKNGLTGFVAKTGATIFQTARNLSPIWTDDDKQAQENVSFVLPFSWKGSNQNPIDITFPLYNTGENSKENIVKNRELIQNIQISHLHSKFERFLSTPPAIFTMEIPGQRYSPVCVIRDLNIDNMGQVNLIDGFPTPDAWVVKMTIQELVPQSRETLLAAINPKGVNGTTTNLQKVNAISG